MWKLTTQFRTGKGEREDSERSESRAARKRKSRERERRDVLNKLSVSQEAAAIRHVEAKKLHSFARWTKRWALDRVNSPPGLNFNSKSRSCVSKDIFFPWRHHPTSPHPPFPILNDSECHGRRQSVVRVPSFPFVVGQNISGESLMLYFLEQ